MIPLPDLLHGRKNAYPDNALLEDLLELAFLGSNETASIHEHLGESPLESSPWDPKLFDEDVFLTEFVEDSSHIELGGVDYHAHPEFLHRVLSRPPVDLQTVHYRQAILRELESDADVRDRTERLYVELIELLDLIKSAHTVRTVDNTPHRLRVLGQARDVINLMVTDFADCGSGLRRIHEAGIGIQATRHHRILTDLLAYEENIASVSVSLQLGADGRIKKLQIEEFEEARDNRFYKSSWRRWRELFGTYWSGYNLSSREMVNRVIIDVYQRIAPSLARVLTLVGHLEVYLTSRAFADTCRKEGLDVCLPTVVDDGALRLRQVFNPLLLRQDVAPVPCDVSEEGDESITVVTGPNSGGKTRLLQGLGLLQLMAQSGLYVAAAEAYVPMRSGLFASVVQTDSADQLEGRLGQELVRIRTLFQHIRPRSMVLIDELCSGTNPSEAAEIVLMVMQLLSELSPRAFITTHFLDLARELDASRTLRHLDFLQVEIDGGESTYQFVAGVAGTSMATETARRLGVDFEVLSQEIHARLERDGTVERRVADGEPTE
ncbi:MAG TPA: DNA mismatch repair protein [Acidobacteriota bacterium]|nr:DNA mismatch repair protein [Acidobacteriota bacterium]